MSAITVFYVDDDQDDLDIFLEAAQAAGAEAHLFHRGDKLIKALLNKSPAPAAVFVDLNMPSPSGFDVMKDIQDTDMLQGIPVVVLSTAADQASISKSRELGARYYIQKPVAFKQLKNAISQVLAIDWDKHDPESEFLHKVVRRQDVSG